MAHRRENPEQRAAFERYFRQGSGRSIERLHDELKDAGDARSLRTLYGWSSRFAWQDRVAEVEGRASADDVERLRAEHGAMQERHQQIGLALQKAGIERLGTLPRDLKPGEVIRLVQIGILLETKARTHPPKKINIAPLIYQMALEAGLDPDQALIDGQFVAAAIED